MRINFPPIEGYEADVGSNTTFDMVNCKNTQRAFREYRHVRDSIYLFHPSLPEVHTKFRECFMGFFDKCATRNGKPYRKGHVVRIAWFGALRSNRVSQLQPPALPALRVRSRVWA
jgi:hypothetical protein